MLLRSRAVIALLSTTLCLTVFFWARSLHGVTGGFVALMLCAFSPMVIAHGQLATSDMCAALFFMLGTWTFWICLHRLTGLRLAACAASLAALTLSKTSVVLFAPVAALMMLLALWRQGELRVSFGGWTTTLHTRSERLTAAFGVLVLCVAVSWAALWLAFGCRFEPYPPGERASFQQYLFPGVPASTLEAVAAYLDTTGKVLLFCDQTRLFPDAFINGTAYVLAALHRYAFLNGSYSPMGWWYFFPYAFLVKTTLPMVLLLAVAGVVAVRAAMAHPAEASRQRLLDRIHAASPLLVLLVVYWTTLLFSTINIGARHMLPVYPAVCVLAGFLGSRPARGWLRYGVVLLLAWHVGEGIRAYPHYLAYFNQFVGRTNAYRHMVDSNLDWGQDLPGLKAWLDRRLAAGPPTRAFIAYFGSGSPEYYRVPAEPLDLELRAQKGLPPVGGAGVYCVSATELQSVYPPVAGRWNSAREGEYQDLIRRIQAINSLAQPKPESWTQAHEKEFAEIERRFRILASARFLAFLRQRVPDDNIGFSILIFELTQDDVRRAFDGPPPELGDAAEAS